MWLFVLLRKILNADLNDDYDCIRLDKIRLQICD